MLSSFWAYSYSSFAAKPIRIANLTLLPRDVCGYAHANMAVPQESTLPPTKASLAAFPGVASLQSAEVSQLWCLGVPGVAPRVLYTAAACVYVFALLVAVKIQPRMLAAEQHGHPCTFWNVPLACAATRAHFWGCGPACFLPSFTVYPACIYIYIYIYII